ncbi:MAG: flagellar biosynthesis protein FlgM [Brevundimonas sp.]|uniref:KPN_02809 family neutral zinc metallopeptidase n=1 Tax=Brevundimonas sp. TaxID=1871086 RepID=UPI000DB5E569|nr:neutral zinc metallopeptidase [Brevundimonas sp.]PZT99262.1 MAG: flagellar biosynthesis protein FlgM [Brevundimonas sp.]
MRWQGGRTGGGGIEDRRGMGGGAIAGGGIGVGVLALIGYFVFGIDPATTTQLASQFGGVGAAEQQGQVGTPRDEAGKFVDVIGGNINDVWAQKLQGYQPPKVVIYEQGTPTGCGYGQSAMGPFYCPTDKTVYLDLNFWQEMETQLGASGADFARAYVIAHEFGHHVQTLTGTSDQVRRAQQRAMARGGGGQAESNRYSVALELQADCYAGVWARNASAVSGGQVALEPGDIEEGMKTAQAIGDDTLQRRSGGRVSPESFTHGSSAQRVEWLQRGYQSGDPASCDTFSGA